MSELAADIEQNYDAVPLDRDEKVHLLCYLRDLRADLAVFAKRVENDLLADAGERRWIVDTLGEVAVRKNTKRSRWDNEGLTARVVALALDERVLDEESGEYESAHSAVARVLSECSRPSWRLTPLRSRGIDESEFCEVTPDGWSVELPPRRD